MCRCVRRSISTHSMNHRQTGGSFFSFHLSDPPIPVNVNAGHEPRDPLPAVEYR
jgi:hypothetical protein